jgi:hypothetical protein
MTSSIHWALLKPLKFQKNPHKRALLCGSGLRPSTTYYYIVGQTFYGTSQELSFTTLPPVGDFPLRLGLVADLVITSLRTPESGGPRAENACRLSIANLHFEFSSEFQLNLFHTLKW